MVGLAVLGLVVAVAVRDVDTAVESWSRMGPLAPGVEIPRFRAQLSSGGNLDNDALRGEVTVLAFWATWCGVCEQQMPDIEALHRDYADRGVRVIGVNQDRDANQAQLVDAYVDERGLQFPVALDTGRMGRAFRVSLIPHVAIVDAQGELRHVHQGRVRADTLRQEIETLLNE